MATVAVTTIMLNEEKNIRAWADSARQADLLMIADTGSEDGSVELARDLGCEVHQIRIDPWRFDRARNTAMDLLPDDIDWLITVDMDEVLAPGWREAFDAALEDAPPEVRRLSYDYVWSWVDEEARIPDVRFDANRCVTRTGWRWYGACHEVLMPARPLEKGEEMLTVPGGFRIEHHADPTKNRSNYLPLLEIAVAEEPDNPRQAYYYGRELVFAGKWREARAELTRFLNMPRATWPPERAAAWQLLATIDNYPERWLLRAIAEDTDRRDPWVALADYYHRKGRRVEAAGMAARALQIRDRPGDYLTNAASWDDSRLIQMMASAMGAGGGVFE